MDINGQPTHPAAEPEGPVVIARYQVLREAAVREGADLKSKKLGPLMPNQTIDVRPCTCPPAVQHFTVTHTPCGTGVASVWVGAKPGDSRVMHET